MKQKEKKYNKEYRNRYRNIEKDIQRNGKIIETFRNQRESYKNKAKNYTVKTALV